MAQQVLLKAQGLFTFPSRLSAVPSGALIRAKNIVINRDQIIESRRGYKIYGTAMGSSATSIAHQLLNYKGRILRHYGTGSGQFLEVDSNGTGTFTVFKLTLTGNTTDTSTTVSSISSTAQLFAGMYVSGAGIPADTTISSITNNTSIVLSAAATATAAGVTLTFTYRLQEVTAGLRIKGVEQNGNFYFTTSDGIKKISAASASDLSSSIITNSGGIKALDVQTTINATAGFLSAASVVAYRILWGINDNNQNLIYGTPSERSVIRNTDVVSKTVDLRITVPKGITTSYFFQIYRTAVFDDASGDQDPGDEEKLVYENNPVAADLTNGYVSVHDITPESFRGANLYTNADTGEGIAQANDTPPLAKDITSFKGYTFFANTKTKQRLNLSLLSVSQLVSTVSTLTITDGTTTNTYTFRTAGDGGEDIATKKVLISAAATPAQQVEETTRSLVRVINNQSAEIVNAFYLSGVNDVPGIMLFEARQLNQTAFYLNVNSASTTGIEFSPNLPASGSTIISSDEVSPNRLYYSKYQQPEAVPILNYVDVGPKDKQIIRVLALRDNLFILKEEGIYRLSGQSTPFQVYPFDFSAIIKAADSAVVLNNLIYLFTNQGVATISDTGVSVISRPIEDQLITLITPQFTNFTTATFGVSYESDRAYYLFSVTDTTDTYATQCFRFNTFTNTWTLLELAKRCGIVNSSDDKLYLGPTDTNYIEQERKAFDRTDFADREVSQTLVSDSVDGTTISLSSITNVSVGDIITQTQYLTMKQYNAILTKLDRDSSLSPHDYYTTLALSPGAELTAALNDLITKIANDPGRTAIAGATAAGTYTALSPAGATFSGQQTTFNALVALLNADAGVTYGNYMTSTSTTTYELPILTVDTSTNQITTNYTYPLIVGPITIYNHIDTDVEFVPQYLTDVSITKHVSDGTFIFEDSSFTQATITYASDLSANFEGDDINGNGPGTFGNTVFGQGIYGGNGSGVPFRTYIPREKARCRYLNVRFQHIFAREIFSIYGISLTFNPVSNRGYR